MGTSETETQTQLCSEERLDLLRLLLESRHGDLREALDYNPTIICSGAALAFLSGQQASIPMWADSFFLGWLFRCFTAPRRFVPRYWKAWKLVWLLARYGRQCPRGGT